MSKIYDNSQVPERERIRIREWMKEFNIPRDSNHATLKASHIHVMDAEYLIYLKELETAEKLERREGIMKGYRNVVKKLEQHIELLNKVIAQLEEE